MHQHCVSATAVPVFGGYAASFSSNSGDATNIPFCPLNLREKENKDWNCPHTKDWSLTGSFSYSLWPVRTTSLCERKRESLRSDMLSLVRPQQSTLGMPITSWAETRTTSIASLTKVILKLLLFFILFIYSRS